MKAGQALDHRREKILNLIAAWHDPFSQPLHEHLGLTLGQFDAWKRDGSLPTTYEPRSAPAPEPEPIAIVVTVEPPRRGRRRQSAGPRFSAEDKARIITDHADGTTVSRLSRRYQAAHRTIALILKETTNA